MGSPGKYQTKEEIDRYTPEKLVSKARDWQQAAGRAVRCGCGRLMARGVEKCPFCANGIIIKQRMHDPV